MWRGIIIKFQKAELVHIVIAIFILGLVFGFDDGTSKFVVSHWISNLIFVTVIVTLSVIIHISIQKYISSKIGAETVFGLWGIDRFSFKKTPEFPIRIMNKNVSQFYLGPILAVILTIISKGTFIFAAVWQIFIIPDKKKRAFKKVKELNNPEIILIAVSGPLMSVILASIFSSLGWDIGYKINALIAVYSMLPLPRLAGSHIVFSSPFSYIFFGALIVISLLLNEENNK